MLWGYFDESGEHAGGRLSRLTVAGCLAPLEVWEKFAGEWSLVLKEHGINDLHMRDLASKKAGFHSPYRGWSEKKKSVFLNRLVSLMQSHIHYYVGAKIPHEKSGTATRPSYAIGVLKMITQASATANGYASEKDDISLVFASHPELEESELINYCVSARKVVQNLGSVTMMPAAKCPQLQAADLFAYEFSHCKDWGDVKNLSPSLKKLRSSEAGFLVDQRYMHG